MIMCEKCQGTGYSSIGGGLEFVLCDCEMPLRKEDFFILSPRPTAVLSTVVLPVDGTYRVETLDLRSGLSALDAHCQDGPVLHFKQREWDGVKLMRVFRAALEDANFHTEAVKKGISRLIKKPVSGKRSQSMRMWGIDPRLMCRKHLLGEHLEMHMFIGALQKKISIQGYIDKGLVEVHNIIHRHNEVARAMEARGYHHTSPIHPEGALLQFNGNINPEENKKELARRCSKCRENIEYEERRIMGYVPLNDEKKWIERARENQIKNGKIHPAIPGRVSNELYDKSIGELNRNPLKYSLGYKIRIIHLIDSVSRGYTTPLEAYQALKADYFPEHLEVRESAYVHLIRGFGGEKR